MRDGPRFLPLLRVMGNSLGGYYWIYFGASLNVVIAIQACEDGIKESSEQEINTRVQFLHLAGSHQNKSHRKVDIVSRPVLVLVLGRFRPKSGFRYN